MNDASPEAALRGDELGALLARVAQGDQPALAALYRKSAAHLYAIALRIVRERAVAEEILQEAFVSVWHHAAAYDVARSQPMTWLAAIVRHRALDQLRRRDIDTVPLEGKDDRQPTWDAPSDAPTPVELLLAGADARAVRDCVEALDAGPKQAIALAFFHGLSHAELAAHMREPLGTVKSWVRRGLERLRRCLENAPLRP
ncbi:MAG TPA: sigma-70 family RNA polymerase sigma factor [Casimicrobiaceae bacterium]|jgi:RNA polymerase sigma-70 factor (ECF subfamily)|nr:sigma-70 family RNA polymerase sigma factor [Casimicrobiaceae bacterium]